MMQSKKAWTLSATVVLTCCALPFFAGEANQEVDQLKEQVKNLTDKLRILEDRSKTTPQSPADAAMAAPTTAPSSDGKVTTKKGKLEIGGLLQVWYYHIQNDSRGLFDTPGIISDTNSASDNDSFRIRRAELRFSIDIHEHVSAFVMIDPASEAASFPQLGVGQKSLANIAPGFTPPIVALNGGNFFGSGANSKVVSAVQTGARNSQPTLLQDALINFHGVVPHHDFTIGQMLTSFNSESFGDNGVLDFVERSYIGNSVARDMGAVIHGSWWCNGDGSSYQGLGDKGRFQYWLGVYNGPGNLFGTSTNLARNDDSGGNNAGTGTLLNNGNGSLAINRSDDNDYKDFIGTTLVRPVWDDCWGDLELGYSFRAGHHGNSGASASALATQSNNFLGQNTSSIGHDTWLKYLAPGDLKGLWFKGEATYLRDRNAQFSVIDPSNAFFQNLGATHGDGSGLTQPLSTFGYWGAVGYKFQDSPFLCDCHDSIWRNFEVDFRFESAPNVFIANSAANKASFTSVYSTKIYTGGINYYIKGQNAKIQLNYNKVSNPEGPSGLPFHNVRNDSLVVNFQVMW